MDETPATIEIVPVGATFSAQPRAVMDETARNTAVHTPSVPLSVLNPEP